jgi:hypothetical protein
MTWRCSFCVNVPPGVGTICDCSARNAKEWWQEVMFDRLGWEELDLADACRRRMERG